MHTLANTNPTNVAHAHKCFKTFILDINTYRMEYGVNIWYLNCTSRDIYITEGVLLCSENYPKISAYLSVQR
jgi:hypothetical protein